MGGLVERRGTSPAVPEEEDRRGRAAVGALHHAEMERDLVALVEGDRPLVMAALRFADDEGAVGAIAEDHVRVADEVERSLGRGQGRGPNLGRCAVYRRCRMRSAIEAERMARVDVARREVTTGSPARDGRQSQCCAPHPTRARSAACSKRRTVCSTLTISRPALSPKFSAAASHVTGGAFEALVETGDTAVHQ